MTTQNLAFRTSLVEGSDTLELFSLRYVFDGSDEVLWGTTAKVVSTDATTQFIRAWDEHGLVRVEDVPGEEVATFHVELRGSVTQSRDYQVSILLLRRNTIDSLGGGRFQMRDPTLHTHHLQRPAFVRRSILFNSDVALEYAPKAYCIFSLGAVWQFWSEESPHVETCVWRIRRVSRSSHDALQLCSKLLGEHRLDAVALTRLPQSFRHLSPMVREDPRVVDELLTRCRFSGHRRETETNQGGRRPGMEYAWWGLLVLCAVFAALLVFIRPSQDNLRKRDEWFVEFCRFCDSSVSRNEGQCACSPRDRAYRGRLCSSGQITSEALSECVTGQTRLVESSTVVSFSATMEACLARSAKRDPALRRLLDESSYDEEEQKRWLDRCLPRSL